MARAARPSQQFYRPPGLRGAAVVETGGSEQANAPPTAGTKQSSPHRTTPPDAEARGRASAESAEGSARRVRFDDSHLGAVVDAAAARIHDGDETAAADVLTAALGAPSAGAAARLLVQRLRLADDAAARAAVVAVLRRRLDDSVALGRQQSRHWTTLLSLVSELYAALGTVGDEELVDVLLASFDVLLSSERLNSLHMVELETLIGALLGAGYHLERHCPDRLVLLRDRLRDGLVDAREPWTRKMVLLMLELSASNWQLAADANDYYFHAVAADSS